MADNWMDDFFGKAAHRPDHLDLEKMTEVLYRMDAGMGPGFSAEHNEAEFAKRTQDAGIDRAVVSYVAMQRALRVLGITTRGQLAANSTRVMQMASLWIDGFMAGSLYRDKITREEV